MTLWYGTPPSRKASMRDKLTDRGWVECGTCEGTGWWPVRKRDSGVEQALSPDRCVYCVDGLVPPDDQVEAAAVAIHWATKAPSDGPSFWLNEARAALVAAAREEAAGE